MKHKLETRLREEIAITSDTQMIYLPYGRTQRGSELPSPDEGKRGKEKLA